MSNEVLVRVENVGKKFCRSLKRSLWYGVSDIVSDVTAFTKVAKDVAKGSACPKEMDATSTVRRELRRGEFWAVDDLSFELRRGECLGLLGRNGAGKTTLLKMLSGLIKPDAGRIEMRGKVGALIALGAGFNPLLTGRENVYVNGSLLGLTKREIDERLGDIIEFAELQEFMDMPVQSYSSGMQVRLGFAVATSLKPDILILDEILSVGDAAFRVKCFNRMNSILKHAAVIFVSHNMAQVTRICGRLLLLKEGHAVVDSTDLGSVITKYHESMPTSERITIVASADARIESVCVQDAAGIELKRLHNGQPFALRVELGMLRDGQDPDLKLLIIVSDEEQNNVAQVLRPIGEIFGKRQLAVTMSFGAAPFNSGKFSVSVALLGGPRGELLAVLYNAAAFVVQANTYGYAPILLEPTTSIIH